MNGIAGWQSAASTNIAGAMNGGSLSLQPLPGSVRPLVASAGSFGGLQSAIGVAVDREDDVYILDAGKCEIKRFDRCVQKFVRLHCVGGQGTEPRQLSDPHGIAISRCGNLRVPGAICTLDTSIAQTFPGLRAPFSDACGRCQKAADIDPSRYRCSTAPRWKRSSRV